MQWLYGDMHRHPASHLAGKKERFHKMNLAVPNPSHSAWQPRIPINHARAEDQAKAVKLRTALETALQRKDDMSISATEREQAGIASYQAAFGYAISARHWRRLFQRTIGRDHGQCDWMRVELYLDDNISPKHEPGRASLASALPEELADTIKTLEDQAAPTAADRTFLFDAAFRLLEDNPTVKPSLIRGLFRAVPALAKTEKALRRMFDRKHAAWILAAGDAAALEDHRLIDSGNFRKEKFSEDKKLLRNRAVSLDGNETLAFRQLYAERAFSQAFMDHYQFDPRLNKSRIPDAVRRDVTFEVEAMLPLHHGPRAAKLAGPSIMRNYDNVAPGDWFSADDWTPEIYFWLNDDNGQPQIMRGECLLFIDVRSRYPLKFLLIAGHYNSEHIRSAILHTHDVHGLPHKGFQFENGVWRATLVEGVGRGTLGFRETARGMAAPDIGLRIRRTYLPRGKVIEGIFNVLQNSQRNLPGYCGPNEQVHKMERLNKFMAQARAGKVHPGNELFEMSEWRKMIDQACMDYANEPQQGRMLDGISPFELWKQRQHLRQLPPAGRYILATHQTQTTIRQDGIWITIRGKRRNYYNEHTGHRIRRTILAFYNVEQPDLLTCCDLDKTNFFTAMHRELPAFDATPEQFAAVNTDRNAHMRHVRTEYDEIVHTDLRYIVRDNSINDADRALGRQHNAAVSQHRHAAADATRKLRKIQRTVAAAGVAMPRNIRNPDRVQEGLDREREIMERLARRRETSPATS
jgi:hypothetical protein